MNILVDGSLPGIAAAFPEPFKITPYFDERELPKLLATHNGLLCRSTLKVNQALLKNSELEFVATASSGTDHLDKEYLYNNSIHIIDAKGCNASSVADYVIASLAYLSQQCLIPGKTAGIIGMGKVGTKVYSRLKKLGFKTVTYDPLKAEHDTQFTSCQFKQLFDCDVLCLHAELHDAIKYPTKNLINNLFLSQLKPNTVLINAARGGIIDEEALLNNANPLVYCTDVFLKEPAISKGIIDKSTLCTPHIAGHSLEAKYMAVEIASRKIHQLYGLEIPLFEKPNFLGAANNNATNWQERILAIYNPIVETRHLKAATDATAAFLTLRKNHNNRHDFALYLSTNQSTDNFLI